MNIDSYEINKETCAVLNLGGEASQIVERENEYLLPRKTYQVMEDSCAYYGSTLDGRVKGTKMILGSNYKLPIIIEDSDMIFFPTTGNSNDNCSWISVNHIEKYEPYKGYTKVKFYEGRTIILKMSFSSFENQLFRAMRLQRILKDRSRKKQIDESQESDIETDKKFNIDDATVIETTLEKSIARAKEK